MSLLAVILDKSLLRTSLTYFYIEHGIKATYFVMHTMHVGCNITLAHLYEFIIVIESVFNQSLGY